MVNSLNSILYEAQRIRSHPTHEILEMLVGKEVRTPQDIENYLPDLSIRRADLLFFLEPEEALKFFENYERYRKLEAEGKISTIPVEMMEIDNQLHGKAKTRKRAFLLKKGYEWKRDIFLMKMYDAFDLLEDSHWLESNEAQFRSPSLQDYQSGFLLNTGLCLK